MNGAYHLIFNDIKETNDSFSRFNAPDFRKDKLDEWYNKEYLKNKEKYAISGCFLKKNELNLFFLHNHDNLLEEEKKVYEIIKDKNFDYLIVTSNESMPGVFGHELSHLLYDSNREYRLESIELIDKLPIKTKNQIKKLLKDYNYKDEPETIYDESQAMIINQTKSVEHMGVDLSKSKDIIKKLKNNFDYHFYK